MCEKNVTLYIEMCEFSQEYLVDKGNALFKDISFETDGKFIVLKRDCRGRY